MRRTSPSSSSRGNHPEAETIILATDAWDEAPRSPELISQPRVRKRVPRACEACRRRKVKCDGKEVCHGCVSASIECVYQSAAGEKMMKDNMQAFDTRLQRLEDMFTEVLCRFDTHSNTRLPTPGSLGVSNNPPVSQPTPPFSYDAIAETIVTDQVDSADEDSRLASTLMSLRKAKRQRHEQCSHRETQDGAAREQFRSVKRGRYRENTNNHRTYADAYGELRADESCQLRYVGLGSTLRLIDVCPPFRRHLDIGLEKKGYGNTKSVFEYPKRGPRIRNTCSPSIHETLEALSIDKPPPQFITTALLDVFYERLYFILPVISREDFEAQILDLDSRGTEHGESDFSPVFYGVLAMAALSIPSDNHIFNDTSLTGYQGSDLAALFFEQSSKLARSKPVQDIQGSEGGGSEVRGSRSLNNVMGLTLQAAYMASIGNQAEAWISIGQAARLGQDIGLHRCPIQLGFRKPDQERRRYCWWCIYSLDRTLSSALGRPFAIRDADCDIDLPRPRSPDAANSFNQSSGFHSILRLRQILGDIVDTVAAVRKVKDTRSVGRIPELRATVVRLNTELQTWSTTEVPQHIKSAETGSAQVERLIALSSYFSALMLLYRYLVPNPHRPSPLRGSEALAQCARAATNCIQITGKIIGALPVCPDLIFHAQHVFAASMILLHCIRRSEDMDFIEAALKDIEVAQRFLRQLQHIWVGSNDLTGLLEEYLEFILNCLEKGVHSETCAFHHEEHEITGLEWREDSGDITSTWSQLNATAAQASPMRGLDIPHNPQTDSFRGMDSRSSITPTIARSPSTMTDLWRFMLPEDQICGGDFGRSWNLDSIDRSFDSLLGGGMETTFNFDF